VTLPSASGTFAGAFAIGATGVTTWALAKATPVIREAASRAQQMMDYAESQQQAVKAANSLGEAIDAVLESAETRALCSSWATAWGHLSHLTTCAREQASSSDLTTAMQTRSAP
jgi:hypothetical protein